MARLHNQQWPVITFDQLHNPQVFVVDMINGFVRQGALADPAIGALTTPIAALLDEIHTTPWFVCDTHEPNAAEFQVFPVHCLKGSEECEVVDELKSYVKPEYMLEKNSISTAAVPGFFEKMKQLPEDCDIIVTGCCTDLCISQLALPLLFWNNQNNRRHRIIVPVDCVDTYDQKDVHSAWISNEQALALMSANGVQIVESIRKKMN